MHVQLAKNIQFFRIPAGLTWTCKTSYFILAFLCLYLKYHVSFVVIAVLNFIVYIMGKRQIRFSPPPPSEGFKMPNIWNESYFCPFSSVFFQIILETFSCPCWGWAVWFEWCTLSQYELTLINFYRTLIFYSTNHNSYFLNIYLLL